MKPTNRFPNLRIPVLACFLAVAALAVHAERKPVALGLVGGITGASFWGDDVKEIDIDVWPTTGVTLAFHLPAFLGVEMDMLYVSKGGAIREKEMGRTIVHTFKLHALEFPLMLKVTAPTGTEVTPYFFGGPSLAYFISRRVFSEYIDIGQGGLVNPEAAALLIEKGDLAEYEWSLCLGGGLEWGLGSIQMRFNLGRESLDKSGDRDVKTVVLAVMAGFIF